MNRPVITSDSDPAIVSLNQPLAARSIRRLERNYIAALAGPDQSVQDVCLNSGSVSASTRKGSRELNLEGFVVATGSKTILAGVLNGLGTSEIGAFACRIAGAELIRSTHAGRDMRSSMMAASDALSVAARKNAHEPFSQTGTCLALAEIGDDTVTFSHLGNCRALLIRNPVHSPGEIAFASIDHTSSPTGGQSRGQVTRALTPRKQELSAQIDRSATLQLNPGDLVIMLSDGITRQLSNEQIQSIVRSEASIVSVSRGRFAPLPTSNIIAEILFEAQTLADNGLVQPLGNQTILVYQHAGNAGRRTTTSST